MRFIYIKSMEFHHPSIRLQNSRPSTKGSNLHFFPPTPRTCGRIHVTCTCTTHFLLSLYNFLITVHTVYRPTIEESTTINNEQFSLPKGRAVSFLLAALFHCHISTLFSYFIMKPALLSSI